MQNNKCEIYRSHDRQASSDSHRNGIRDRRSYSFLLISRFVLIRFLAMPPGTFTL